MQNIDLSLNPGAWGAWPVRAHHAPAFGSTFEWGIDKVNLKQTRLQKQGGSTQVDHVKKELSSEEFANANVLDFLLANQHLIPDSWKGKRIFALNTIYRPPLYTWWKPKDLKHHFGTRVHRYIEWRTAEKGWQKDGWGTFICVETVAFRHDDHFLTLTPSFH